MTIRLYRNDSYLKEFQAEIKEILTEDESISLILDQSAFYPESGGQPSDWGFIENSRVTGVQQVEEYVLHLAEKGTSFHKGQKVTCHIDWSRRFDHMQQHTGQHILSQAFLKSIGAETESFHLGTESSTIDLSVPNLSREDIYSGEDLANQIVYENRKVFPREILSEDQDKFPIRKKSDRSGRIRVVEVEGFDYSPCGGTHCNRTGEVGIIKVRRWERVRKNARVEFYCGRRALLDYRKKNRDLFLASRIFSVGDSDVIAAIEKSQTNQKFLSKQLEKQNQLLLEMEAAKLVSESKNPGGYSVITEVFENYDLKALNKLASAALNQGAQIVILASKTDRPCLLFTRHPDLDHLDMNEWIQRFAPKINGRGGGTRDRAQAVGSSQEGIDSILSEVIDLLNH